MALDGDDDDDDGCRALRSAKNQGGTFHIKQKAKQKANGQRRNDRNVNQAFFFSMRGRGLTTEQRNAIQLESGHNT